MVLIKTKSDITGREAHFSECNDFLWFSNISILDGTGKTDSLIPADYLLYNLVELQLKPANGFNKIIFMGLYNFCLAGGSVGVVAPAVTSTSVKSG